jgi:hypothetical protein
VDVVLPLHLTAEHFSRALPALAKALAVLAPEHTSGGRKAPRPEAWLEVGCCLGHSVAFRPLSPICNSNG